MLSTEKLRWWLVSFLLLVLLLGSAGTGGRGSPIPAAPQSPAAAAAVGRADIPPLPPAPASAGGNDSWQELGSPPSGLSARSQAAVASDPSLGGILLFGGYNWTGSTGYSDTWLFANGTWTDLGAPFLSTPPARWGAALAYDAADGYLVLFGGRDRSGTLSDTWILSASAARSWAGWTQLTPTTAPSARAFASAFYDPDTSSVILFGGGCFGSCGSSAWVANNETWSFSAGGWTNRTATVGTPPGALMTGYAAWDPQLDGAIEFAGERDSNDCSSPEQTWLFHGTWTNLSTNGTPSLAAYGGMAWYAPESEMVLYGGLEQSAGNCAPDNETTWVLQAYNWTDVTTASNASALIGPGCCGGLAYDPFGQVVVLFGGASQNQTYYNTTWSYPAFPLVVQMSASGTEGLVNVTTLGFSASATGGLGPYAYNWSFGDGSPNATTENASHVYATPGKYDTVGQAADSAGRVTRISFPVSIVAPLSLNATAGALTGEVPFPVNFNATGAGGFHPYTWTWAFGDGFRWNGPNVTHTYSISGTFNVTLFLNDSYGEHTTAHFVAHVYGRLLASILPSATNVLAPTDVNFTAALDGGISPFLFFWTFAPGATSNGQQVDYDFATPGTYNVTLVVTDGLGYGADATVTVHVYAHLSATCEVSDPIEVAGATEHFTALPVGGGPPLYYTWNFGDESPTVPGLTTTHQYLQAGNYTVDLKVTDSLGETVTTSIAVEVVRPLVVGAASNATEGPGPFSVTLTATTTGGLAPLVFVWSFGDGGSAIGPTQRHTFPVGVYSAKVTVTDNLGENTSATVRLTAYPALAISAAAEPPTLVLGNVTTLTATVSGGVAPTTLTWHGLPPGCYSRNTATIDCLPTTTGSFTVAVNAIDSVHENVSATIALDVTPVNTTACCAPSPSPSGVTPLDLAGIAVVVVIVAAVVVVLVRRGRRPPESPGASADGDPVA